MTKNCGRCKQDTDFSEFSPCKKGLHGLLAWCKQCARKYANEKYAKDPKTRDRVHKNNVRLWAELTPEDKVHLNYCRREKASQNREETNAKSKLRRSENPDVNRKQVERKMVRYHSDENFRLKENLRSRLRLALISGQKAGSAVRDLGCSIPEFRAYIESKFQPGMTWNNRGLGKGTWQLDHIVPLAHFDLTNRQHLILACNYLNIQPLWMEHNITKGKKYEAPIID